MTNNKMQLLPLALVAALLVVLSVAAVVIFSGEAGNPAEDSPSGADQYSNAEPVVEETPWSGWQSASALSGSVLRAEPSDEAETLVELTVERGGVIIGRSSSWYLWCSGNLTGWIAEDSLTTVGEIVQFSQTTDAECIDLGFTGQKTALDRIAKKYRCAGVSLAVIEDGAVKYTYQYGYADKTAGTVMTADTKIRCAELSMLPVAMSALSMQESGVLSLEEDLSDVLGYTVGNPRYPDIALTMQQLLTYSSTLDEDVDYSEPLENVLTDKGYYLAKEPGKKKSYLYNLPSVGAAGAIMELASGTTLFDYTDSWLFKPLDADASYTPSRISSQGDIATLYSKTGKVSMTVEDQLAVTGSDVPGENRRMYTTGLTISATDLARVLCILIGDGCYNGQYFLSADSVSALETQYSQQSPYGQMLIMRSREGSFGGRNLIYHSAIDKGVMAYMSYDPESGDGVVVLTTGCNDSSMYGGTNTVCSDFAKLSYSSIITK